MRSAFRALPILAAIVGAIVALAGCGTPPTARVAVRTGATATTPAGTVFQDCRDCPQMVVVPPGAFTMGVDGGEPERYEGAPHRVTLAKPFAVGRYEVTVGQYKAFVAATGHPDTKEPCNVTRDGKLGPLPGSTWRNPGYGRPAADDEPVSCVTWDDAKAYVAWLATKSRLPYRLLTEAEWEYAARAGRTGRFAWGDDPNAACREANVLDRSAHAARPDLKMLPAADCDDGFPSVAPVGQLQPNPFGLYDVIGNDWEWVEDCYAMPYPADGPTDGSAQLKQGCDRRGTRGGSWISAIDRQRPTFRGRDPVDRTSQIFGFRVARDLR
jgi:formylglycine-generating enzyme required for sulfatase activity